MSEKDDRVGQMAALRAFESLSSEVRLQIFRRLAEAGEEGLVAGRIAHELGIPPTNLSFHTKALLRAGLVTVHPEGRFQRYRANVPQMLRVMAYVTESCFAAGAGSGKRTASHALASGEDAAA